MKIRLIVGALVAVACLSWVTPTSAQTLTGLQVTFFRQGQTTPAVAPFTIPMSQFQCGQPIVAAPAGTALNPDEYRVEDPADATKDCVKQAAAGDPLLLLAFDPAVTYTAKANWINSAGMGPESAASNPFSRPGLVPNAPTRLRIIR